ncbi:MAG: hypothetical protein M3249_02290 [Thermoproteota archaeon]|nr:hypothetical protein [Thermoproteota archaeon]
MNERPALGLIVVAAGFLGIVLDIHSVFGFAAESFLTIERSSIVSAEDDGGNGGGDNNELRAELDVEGVQIPTNGTHGAFGYGIITEDGDDDDNDDDATMLVTHTHSGLLDSESQRFIEDPIWHNHFVRLGDVEQCGGEDRGVIDITWQSPGEVGIDDNIATISDVPTGEFEGRHSMTGESLSITLGQAASVSDVISFKLDPVFEEDGLKAVCLTDIRSAEEVVNPD